MLALRPNCECCDKDLPPEAADAMICTFECTFCRDCVETQLIGVCPNCGGNFERRPIRPAEQAGEISAIDRARVQAAGVWQGGVSRNFSAHSRASGNPALPMPERVALVPAFAGTNGKAKPP